MTAGTHSSAPDPEVDAWGPTEPVALWFMQVVVSAFWASLLVALFFGGERPDPVPIWLLGASSLSIWAVYVGGPIVITRLRGAGPLVDLWARVSTSDLPIGLTVGIALQLLALPVLYWPIGQLTDTDPGAAAEAIVDLVDGPLDVVLLVLVVAVGAPLAEEFFYRGMLLQGLRRRVPDVAAVLVSSALFALVHIQPILYPGTFLLGVVAAAATLRTRRLGLAWGMHIGFNGAALLALLIA